MFSHLRIHRRGPSNPTSPNPDQPSAPAPWDPSLPQQHSPFIQDAALSPGIRSQLLTTTNSSLPPTLPPIARVTSSSSGSPLDLPTPDAKVTQEPQIQKPHPPPPPPSARSPYNGDSGFLGGVALRKYQREQQEQQKQQKQQMAAKSPDLAGLSPSLMAAMKVNSRGRSPPRHQ
ncbi:uncharacterized protein ColSpa_04437 [Colletotrichum spaethianum]|uniref:Uncharacterized protein n=1 Tax=Colletotrichum spaethianum TaxID=700344 RepID=A0AA37P5N4_9PEZI|nr:uncharacterized protein ColSpa_04437 [Colletotrichum spaethianum]GKT44256.1 hypothetical protein ColSpa_04437 [Colletotrichum spaethianum]